MKRFLLLVLSIFLSYSSSTNAQNFNPYFASIVEEVAMDNVVADLTTFESFGVKEIGTSALDNAENWITDRYMSLGYSDISLQSFTVGGQSTNNIIITKTGTVYPNTFLIIDAHYDTINGPGVNDNGSGTVLLLEIARLLANVDTDYSIKFIHFSGEEDGLIGSDYYVNNTVNPENLDISLVFNIDQVGGVSGETNNTITCERDESNPSSNNAASAEATEILANCVMLYSSLFTQISFAYASDYVPFENNGEVITGLYETNETPFSHGPNDTLANMDPQYLTEVIKGALGATLHFAGAREVLETNEFDFKNIFTIYPNPSNGLFEINTTSVTPFELNIFDTLGREIYASTLTQDNTVVDITGAASGMYVVIFKTKGSITTQKIFIE